MNQESRIMKNVSAFILVSCFFLLASALPVFAQEGLIVCNGPDCGFDDLAKLVVKLINFLIMLSTILATAAFAWAGILLLTSGGSESKKEEAKTIFMKVLKGYLWILGAWLLVYTITSTLLNEGYFFLGDPK